MLTLKRTYGGEQTDGILTMPDGYEIRTIELPWRDNMVNVSCIPEGQYIIERDHTGRHRWFRLDVEGRTFIEIHQASRPEHLLGCIGVYDVEDLERLVDWFGEDNWVLEITS